MEIVKTAFRRLRFNSDPNDKQISSLIDLSSREHHFKKGKGFCSQKNLSLFTTSSPNLLIPGHQQYTSATKKNSFKISMPDINYDRHQQCNDTFESEDRQQIQSSKMCILDQYLGSDAESLPSCEESLTNSENSPPNSPPAFKKKVGLDRRESAPASLNVKFVNSHVIKVSETSEQTNRESHRRYSSVEERTSRVRFNLEESFKEEECRYEKQFEEEEDHHMTKLFSDVEPFKVSPSSQTYSRKVSCPPCLSCDIEEVRQDNQQTKRKDSSESRTRKCSVYSDNSGSIQILPGQSIKKIASNENLIVSEQESLQSNAHRKTSLQEYKTRKYSKVDNRKLSLQENSNQKKSSNGEERSSKENSRKFSLQGPRRRQSFSDRKLSLQNNLTMERKISTDGKYTYQERKTSLSDRKSLERKTSQPELRKISLTDTFRSVVGTKKKAERKQSQETLADENNNLSSDKKSAWGLIKNKMKKDRKSSNDAIQQGSPRMIRLLSRNDSSSSLDSGTPKRHRRRTDSAGKRSPRSEDDQKSISSYTSMDLEDEPQIVPLPAFDVWSDGKVEIDTNSGSLPLLHVAAGEGNKQLVSTLIHVGVDINEMDQCGWPALHYAVCAGHFECAQLLLSKGATLNSYSNKVMNTYCSAVRDCIRTGSPYASKVQDI